MEEAERCHDLTPGITDAQGIASAQEEAEANTMQTQDATVSRDGGTFGCKMRRWTDTATRSCVGMATSFGSVAGGSSSGRRFIRQRWAATTLGMVVDAVDGADAARWSRRYDRL